MQKVESQKCFRCGHTCDHVESTIRERPIKDNDAIVCFYCGAIGKWFNGHIVEVSKIELNVWRLLDEKMYNHIIAVSDAIKRKYFSNISNN
jgi:hypothetical protein